MLRNRWDRDIRENENPIEECFRVSEDQRERWIVILEKINREPRRTVTDNRGLMSFLEKLEMGNSSFSNWTKSLFFFTFLFLHRCLLIKSASFQPILFFFCLDFVFGFI